MSRYFVYENWTHDRARIHKADCGHCNDGRGTQAGSSNRNGKWHGPYDDRGEAFRAAGRLGREDTKPCPKLRALVARDPKSGSLIKPRIAPEFASSAGKRCACSPSSGARSGADSACRDRSRPSLSLILSSYARDDGNMRTARGKTVVGHLISARLSR